MSDPDKIKHLEFIEAVVSRQATNSFLVKGWALTVALALYGFSAAHLNWYLAALGLVPVLVFWLLDSYFLRQERLFRCLYDEVRQPDSEVELFSLNAQAYTADPRNSLKSCFKSQTLVLFFGALLLVGIGLVVAGLAHDSTPAKAERTASAKASSTSSGHVCLGGQIAPIASVDQRGTT
ncbi:MAG: hypothetical protein U0W40_17165 [Acidimicrobiia bacterium]